MKNERKPVGQYILDEIGDVENSDSYIEELLPLIGEVVLFFNGLESSLDHHLCEAISDRSDQQGLLVLHNLVYATKVDLFQRFSDDIIRSMRFEIPSYETLLPMLRECGLLRNRVVHANWEYTNEEGYTHVRFKISKNGIEHDMWQFSVDSLRKVIDTIIATREVLGDFQEELTDCFANWSNEIASRKGGGNSIA